MLVQGLIAVSMLYVSIGLLLFVFTTPINGQDYADTGDLKLYMFAWPLELYRMYNYSDDGDY